MNTLSNAWDVFLLFTVPIGGGIPAGVVLGNEHGLSWTLMTLLYFLSDVVLACVFEPVMLLFAHWGKRSPKVAFFIETLKKSVIQITAKYGVNPSPLLLVVIAFGVDPMTGRAATLLAGHGFFTGWALAILGDLFFFLLIMSATLWLNAWLGNGTWAAVIITIVMIFGPGLFRKLKAAVTR